MRQGLEKALVLPQLAVLSVPVSVRHLVVGAAVGSSVKIGADVVFDQKLPTLGEALDAGLVGALTNGKGIAASLTIGTGYELSKATVTGSSINGGELAGKAIGTIVGGNIGKKVENAVATAAFASAIRGAPPVATGAIVRSQMPLSAIASSVTSEGTERLVKSTVKGN
ncbi:MAG: hypothetical protein ACK5PF_03110 [bacterium]